MDGVRLHPRTCGTPLGLAAHERAGTEPCVWCLRESGTEDPPPQEEPEDAMPEPQMRHYLTDSGVVIAGDGTRPGLARLLETGRARELTGDEARERLA